MTEDKNVVDLLQNFIAVHSTRKEICVHLLENVKDDAALSSDLKSALQNSSVCINELLAELSLSGDAIKGFTDKKDPYHELWNTVLSRMDTASENDMSTGFIQLENELKHMYEKYADRKDTVPESVRTLFKKHAAGLAVQTVNG